MPVPANTYATRRLRPFAGLALLCLLAAPPLLARGPDPAARIALDSLGFQHQTEQFLLAGSSMLTLNYVDPQHLLLTFKVHQLMERIANDPPEDEDRVIEAVLLEVPSGRVLARTDWRLHDSGQYLWDLGHGRFLLRIRDTLTTFAPMAHLASGDPFRQRLFLTTSRRVGAVLLSPEADLLIVESVERTPPVPPPAAPLFGPAPKPTPAPLGRPGDRAPVAVNFYRLLPSDNKDEDISETLAGIAHASDFGGLAATGAGHIAIVDQGQQHWAFDFHPYHGDVKELSSFDSSCRPTPRFVSNSEFVSFGCHGGNAPHVLGGFNMHGEEMWEQNLPGDLVAPSFVFAPASGRFALGRVLGIMPADDTGLVPSETLTSQNVVVYQTESGKQILRVDCSPIARAGQNFALSPDGMGLAVIHASAIEIYALPPLTAQEQAEVKEARSLVPEPSVLPIEFAVQSPASFSDTEEADRPSNTPSNAHTASAAAPGLLQAPRTSDAPATTPPASVAAARAASNPASIAADAAEPEQPRKPPTLYTLPTDHAQEQAK
jgi:hypothetical protein